MSPTVKKFENRPTFIKVMNECQVARF